MPPGSPNPRRTRRGTGAADPLSRGPAESRRRTLNALFDDLERLPRVEIVQLAGRFGGDLNNSQDELTRRTVALAGGAARAIPAPFFIDDARAANALRRRPEVASVVAEFDRIGTAVVGIGAVHPRPVSIAYSAVPARFTERVLQSGAVGEGQGTCSPMTGTASTPACGGTP